MSITINKISDSEVEIIGEVPAADFMSHWATTIKKLGEHVEIDGFRKGNAPEKILIDKIGEERILIEMAEATLSTLYPALLAEHKLDAIGQPQISITKLAKDNPLGFTLKTAIVPVVKLLDYRTLAKSVVAKAEKPTDVTEKEVTAVVDELRKHRALAMEENKDLTPEDKDKIVLPELTDEFVKTLGNFETVEDFKAKIKENLTAEKAYRAKEKTRLEIMNTIADQVTVTLPEILVTNELDKMVHELRHETSRMGLKFDDYLIHLKKTEDELKAGWRTDAEKRVKLGLIINAIIDDAKLEATREELDGEIAHLMSHFGDNTPSDTDLMRLHSYAENTILHKKVFEILEGSN